MHVTINKGLLNKPWVRWFSSWTVPEGMFGASPVMSHLSNYLVVKPLAPKAHVYWAQCSYIMFFAEQHLGFTSERRTGLLPDPTSAYRDVGGQGVSLSSLWFSLPAHPHPNQPVRAGRDRQHNPQSGPQGTKPDIGVTGARFDSS